MSNDKLNEAHARTVEWQAAFIQGVAASAIAFAIHETGDRKPSLSLLPIALAVLAWSITFLCGILNNHARQRSIAANIAMNLSENGNRLDLYEKAEGRFKGHTRWAHLLYQTQLFALLAGALLYVAGHGLHIVENAKTDSATAKIAAKPKPPAPPTKN